MAGESQQQSNCRAESEPGNPAGHARELRADTLLAERYSPIPLGAAVALLIVTPIMGSDPGWPFFAAGILATGATIPYVLHRKIVA